MKGREKALDSRNLIAFALAFSASLPSLNSTVAAQQYLFGRADFATGKTPVAVATADFNGDEKPDLAVVNAADNTVSILLGKPEGTFQPRQEYATASGLSIAVADFDRNGKLDLAVGGGDTISILRGNGDGTFQGHIDYPSAGGRSVVAGDFNGDGKIDLAAVGAVALSILMGNGDGTFQPHLDYTVHTEGTLSSAAVTADFNGDGKLDLAVANSCDCYRCSSLRSTSRTGSSTFRAQRHPPG